MIAGFDDPAMSGSRIDHFIDLIGRLMVKGKTFRIHNNYIVYGAAVLEWFVGNNLAILGLKEFL
jgi:hypothetical protein